MQPIEKNNLNVLFEHVKLRGLVDPSFPGFMERRYKRSAKWSNIAVRTIVALASLIVKAPDRSVKYFFWGTKFAELILTLPRADVCVVGGHKHLIFCLRNRVNFLSCLQLWAPLAICLSKQDEGMDCSFQDNLYKAIARAGSNFKIKAKSNAVLVLDNDATPINRSLIFASRLADIKCSICIQDGLFQSKSPGHIMYGWFADLIFVINEHQKVILVDKGMDAKKIKIMGFHSSPYVPKRPIAEPGHRLICFFGQPWVLYDIGYESRYREILKKLSDTLHNLGYMLYYKPHPLENETKNLLSISDIAIIVNVPLHKVLENYDVFISLTSTALIEADAAGRVAVQLLDDGFAQDDFSLYGSIQALQILNDRELLPKLRKAIDMRKVNMSNDYNHPASHFIQLVADI